MPRRIYHGWVVVIAAFTVMFIGFGAAYAFAAFFDSFEREFQASRTDVSFIFSICGLLYFALGAVSGPLTDRFGAGRIIAFGMVLVALGLIVGSRAGALWQIYLSYSVAVGLGVGFSYVPSVSVVQRWFVRRRGMASGVAVSGIGAGTMLAPPIADLLIAWSDWRTTYVIFGGFALVVGLLCATQLTGWPSDRGVLPDGDAGRPANNARPGDGLTLREGMRTRLFWDFYVSAALLSVGMFVPFVHLSKYAADHGHAELSGGSIISLLGLGSMLGRFFLGGLADRWGRRRTMVAMYAGLALMQTGWLMLTGFWPLVLLAVMLGLFYGGFVALAPALITDYFGSRQSAGMLGMLYTAPGLGTFFGPVLAGWAYDRWGSYVAAILAAAILSYLATLIMLRLPEPASWQRKGG